MPGRYVVAVTGYGDWDFIGSHWRDGEYELRFTVEPLDAVVRAVTDGTDLHMYAWDLGDPDPVGGTREILFDVGWHESWRGPERPSWVEAADNWDAVWLFAKYREFGGEWRHATLTGAFAPSGAAVDLPADGRGVFLYRPHSGYGEHEHDGHFGAGSVELTWAYAADGVAADALLEVRIFGVEMVHVPEGTFFVGSGGTGQGEFRDGGTADAPFAVTGQGAITLGPGAGNLDWTEDESSGAPEAATVDDFPTGYGAFYIMKYELTQGQYAAFLNTLTQQQADVRRYDAWCCRYELTGDRVGHYGSSLPHVPLNFATWADGAAFADWAGLRPMTELELEKAARGPATPVADEYAWGSTQFWPAVDLADPGTVSEVPVPEDANTNVDAALGIPIRVGAFAAPNRSREAAGAGNHGALDLSGNLWENVVTLGHPDGRTFTGQHGDGAVDGWGDADVDGWPGADASGAGFRGGDFLDGPSRARVSDRVDVAQVKAWRDPHDGWRGARTAP